MRAAGPGRAEVAGAFAVAVGAGGDEDLAVPVPGDLQGEPRGGAEAVEAEAGAGLDAGETQGAVADDAAAEEGRGLDGVEVGGRGWAKAARTARRSA